MSFAATVTNLTTNHVTKGVKVVRVARLDRTVAAPNKEK